MSSIAIDLSEPQQAALAAAGIPALNEAQLRTIPEVLAGHDVVLHAGTGTGKTLAYLLPVLQMLRDTPDLRAVVVAPGTALGMQTVRGAREVAPDGVTVAAAAATTSRKRQKKRVTNSTRLIVGTPDRISELFAKRKLKGVRVLVLDELDPILAAQASSFLTTWLQRSEPAVQKIVASATLGRRSTAFLSRFAPDAVLVRPSERPLVQAITHRHVAVRGAKEIALARFVQEHRCRRAIVFVSEPRLQSHLLRYLGEHDIEAVAVAREGSKEARRRGLQAFRDGKAALLLTTDRIARGLDVPEVDWVLHYDLPNTPEEYVHRAGRTGRAGREGTSVVFVDDRGRSAFRRLQRALDLPFA